MMSSIGAAVCMSFMAFRCGDAMKTTGFSEGMRMAVADLQDPDRAEERDRRLVETEYLAAEARGMLNRERTAAAQRFYRRNQPFHG